MVLADPSVELRQRFETAFDNVRVSIPFDKEWRDETGRLSGAVRLDLKIGEVVKTVCPDSNRRIILVGTPMDTVAVYERHNLDEGRTFKLVYNSNSILDRLLGGSFLSIAQFSLIITDYDVKENMGTFLDKMYVSMRNHSQPLVQKVG